MSWFRKELSVSRSQAEERLVGLPSAFLLSDAEQVFLGAFPLEETDAIDPEPELRPELGVPSVPRWVGLLPYEAFRDQESLPLSEDTRPRALSERCHWRRYAAVAVLDRRGFRVEGDDRSAVERLAEVLSTPREERSRPRPHLEWAEPPEDAAVHEARIKRALVSIGRGELYQVNLARRFSFRVSGHPIELLRAAGTLGQAPFSAALDFGELGVVSGSPELFLDHLPDGRIETCPIKGTRPRSADPKRDLELRIELDSDEKEQAELTMVIDIERNDLGRLARVGSVRLSRAPHVVSHPTVHHREATVAAVLRPEVSRTELLRALLPSGSVTGAPKRSAMDLIRALEPERRGLYTGALGYLAHDGHLRLSMAIRVLLLRGSEAHYFAGGGIVADSVPAREVEETWWKTRLFGELLGAEPESSAEN